MALTNRPAKVERNETSRTTTSSRPGANRLSSCSALVPVTSISPIGVEAHTWSAVTRHPTISACRSRQSSIKAPLLAHNAPPLTAARRTGASGQGNPRTNPDESRAHIPTPPNRVPSHISLARCNCQAIVAALSGTMTACGNCSTSTADRFIRRWAHDSRPRTTATSQMLTERARAPDLSSNRVDPPCKRCATVRGASATYTIAPPSAARTGACSPKLEPRARPSGGVRGGNGFITIRRFSTARRHGSGVPANRSRPPVFGPLSRTADRDARRHSSA
jgi:hypothetical protein